jgi:hypothetical protein
MAQTSLHAATASMNDGAIHSSQDQPTVLEDVIPSILEVRTLKSKFAGPNGCNRTLYYFIS